MNEFFTELYRIFFGTHLDIPHLFAIVFRTGFMYLYAILNVRLMDTRSLGLLTPFEIIVIIALGSAVGDPMFYRDIPLIHGMLVISTIVIFEHLISKWTTRNATVEQFFNGEPVLLIKDGIVSQKEMYKQNLTEKELHSILRLRGVKRIADVEVALLEPSGNVSILLKDHVPSDLIPLNLHLKQR